MKQPLPGIELPDRQVIMLCENPNGDINVEIQRRYKGSKPYTQTSFTIPKNRRNLIATYLLDEHDHSLPHCID